MHTARRAIAAPAVLLCASALAGCESRDAPA
jgi:hypothetical protein